MLAKQSPHHKPDHPGPFYVRLWFIVQLFWLFDSAIVWAIVWQDVCVWKSFIIPLDKLYHIFWQILNLLVFDSWWQNYLSFPWTLVLCGCWSSKGMSVPLFVSESFDFLFLRIPSETRKKFVKKKKNQTLLYIWLSFLGFRFSTPGKIMPKRKTV